MQKNSKTFKLFKRTPGFVAGAGSIFDLRKPIQKYNASDSDNVDYNAIVSDWFEVGKDMRKAIKFYEQQAK